ncbi:MAG: T9SS type A sorting domain-containing protein [Saprospiraceae bacterium]|nr:T9SS type A sorting domain-containing protein [Saprospiraceae bacterium]
MPVLSELSDSLPVDEKKGLSLGVYSVRSLPNFPNYRLYDFPDSPCDTLGIDTPVAVKEPLANLSIKAYPNPVTDTWYLEAGFSSGRLHIFDFSGRMIRQIDWAGSADNLQVLVHDWPAGMYYWHWQPESGEVQSGWFVKM